ncbi:MAG: CHAD domain-containing protein [Hyphomicrobiales bacterium]|nr:CHAD domain-containing protein [Hyphomicrobiales bacterium]MDE2113417.1 CHAD domain-containing protein [Hyphomicrobiales bacterium]
MDEAHPIPNLDSTKREVEVKFTCDPAIFPKLVVLLGSKATAVRVRTLHSTYFDTAGFALNHAGVSLRMRTGESGKKLWCIKAAGEKTASLFTRTQIEVQDQAKRSVAEQFDGDTGDWLAALVDGEALVPQFTVDVRRQQLLIEHLGATIEIAMDEGQVNREAESRPFTELELELKSGDERSLLDFARFIAGELALALNFTTKADRGFGLALPRGPKRQMARPLASLSGLSFGPAIARSGANALDNFTRNWAALLRGRDPEAIHQSRVALRKFRDLTGLYNDACPHPDFGKVQNNAKDFGKVIGMVRNLDVFLKAMAHFHTVPDIDPQGLAAVGVIVDRHHARACENVRLAIRNDALTQFVLKAQEQILQCDAMAHACGEGGLEAPMPAAAQASVILGRLHHDMLKAGRGFSKLSRKRLHALRLQAKEMRTATDFFARVADCDLKVSRYVKALEALQKALGKYNDSRFALHFLKALSQEASPEVATCIQKIRRDLKGFDKRERQELPRIWKKFKNSDPCW